MAKKLDCNFMIKDGSPFSGKRVFGAGLMGKCMLKSFGQYNPECDGQHRCIEYQSYLMMTKICECFDDLLKPDRRSGK